MNSFYNIVNIFYDHSYIHSSLYRKFGHGIHDWQNEKWVGVRISINKWTREDLGK